MVGHIQLSLDASHNTLLKLKLWHLHRGSKLRIVKRAFTAGRSRQRALDRQVLCLNRFQLFQRDIARI